MKKHKKVIAGILAGLLCTNMGLLPATASNFKAYQTGWGFFNSDEWFGANNFIDEETYQTMKNNYKHTEKWAADRSLRDVWGGSCYGLASTSVLNAYEPIDYSRYGNAQSSNLFDATFDIEGMLSDELLSLLNYYSCTQFLQANQQATIRQMYRTNSKQRLQNLVKSLSEGKSSLIAVISTLHNNLDGYEDGEILNHAVVAYETGTVYDENWTTVYAEGISEDFELADFFPEGYTQYANQFDKYVFLWDPNNFGRFYYPPPTAIFYNSQTWDWYIPNYGFGTIPELSGSENNDGLIYMIDDPTLLNDKGLIGTTNAYIPTDDYIDIFLSLAEENTYSLKPISFNDGNWEISNADMSNAYMTRGFLSCAVDSNSSYILPGEEHGYVFEAPSQELLNTIFYENSTQYIYAENGTQTVNDPSGYLSFSGTDTDYTIELITNENYTGGFFDVEISGHGNEAQLHMVEDGYLLHADNLNDVLVVAEDGGNMQVLNLNAEETTVLLKKSESGLLTAYTDNDADGVYETSIEENGTGVGDIDQSGTVDASDAAEILVIAAEMGSSGNSDANNTLMLAADVDNNGTVDAVDAALLLQYSAEAGSGSTQKTLQEYVIFPRTPVVAETQEEVTE